jgi:hypothetical protein
LGQPDPLIAALAAAPTKTDGRAFKVDRLFGDRPEVLDAIRANHARGVTSATLAEVLTASLDGADSISDSAIDSWLKKPATR